MCPEIFRSKRYTHTHIHIGLGDMEFGMKEEWDWFEAIMLQGNKHLMTRDRNINHMTRAHSKLNAKHIFNLIWANIARIQSKEKFKYILCIVYCVYGICILDVRLWNRGARNVETVQMCSLSLCVVNWTVNSEQWSSFEYLYIHWIRGSFVK